MAETSNSIAGTNLTSTSALSPGFSEDSSMEFWCNLLTSNNQNDTSYSESQNCYKPCWSSRLDLEWGYVLDNSVKIDKKSKKRKKDVGCNSVVNSSSDISEALSVLSAALSLSSSASSGDRAQEKEKEEAGLVGTQSDNLEDEMMDKSIENDSTSSYHPLPLETNEDDALSSDRNGEGIETKSTTNGSKEARKDNFPVPELGMEFSSEKEIYEFYNNYAKEIGFSVRKGKVQRLSDGSIRKRYFLCSKQGFRLKKKRNEVTKFQRKETRTGCNAMIQCKVENGKWVIIQFLQEHNHELKCQKLVTESCAKTSEEPMMIGSRSKSEIAKDSTVVSKSAGCCDMDFSRNLPEKKINNLQPEDVQSLINHLRHLQVEDPSFFHTVQLDADGRISNFFWRDGRSKMDYDYFGDVLVLDTTFKMDKYDMICAQFLGLNHHRQFVLFGCAFLVDESVNSFTWLFETFMEVMGRRQPKTVITDEGQAMANAIKLVLPEAQHQLGLWYIRQNAAKHLSRCYSEPGFKNLFNEWISGCQTEEEFESRWDLLVQQFNLRENPWLHSLYMSREKWAYVYSKKTFLAGIQGIVNIKSTFQNSTSKTMSLPLYLQQYLEAAEQGRQEELHEDFRCNETESEMILDNSLFEEQAGNVYTCTMFKIFQKELLKCFSVAIAEVANDGTSCTFKLTEKGQKNTVEFSYSDSSVTCSCKKYESVGILCVHALKVLNAREIWQIPSQYILKRWTKAAKEGVTADHDHGQKMASKRQQQSVSSLMHKSLNLITKSVALKECQNIAENFIDMGLMMVESALRTKCMNHLPIRHASSFQNQPLKQEKTGGKYFKHFKGKMRKKNEHFLTPEQIIMQQTHCNSKLNSSSSWRSSNEASSSASVSSVSENYGFSDSFIDPWLPLLP